ncbi:TetR/AcrR family transcriptional regulator [Nannocystis punicea]|uniref:TetR/AcrR family transcriptional regulator n=1 Tax=Nannocystis punicea TaxID=2995304 RepID=A0ABY7H5D4_9BACT|nr:TetR/AcrR family transcriptional regulator [Nannocystis poenicansa]WAS94402.1 TetR/AcrR family transcriptional regulator [Nannocystis poenicansa]
MPLPRFTTLAPERRAAILAAAAEEFARAGLEGASYNRIIARAGASKGAMYYYFDNKEDLLLTVVADLAERSAAAIGRPGEFADAAGFWRELRALCARMVAFFLADPHVAGLAKRLLGASGESAPGRAVAARSRQIEHFTAELLRQGQAVGAVRTDLPLELLAHLVTGVGEAVDRWLLARTDPLQPDELAALPDRCVDLVARLAAPEPSPPRRAT